MFNRKSIRAFQAPAFVLLSVLSLAAINEASAAPGSPMAGPRQTIPLQAHGQVIESPGPEFKGGPRQTVPAFTHAQVRSAARPILFLAGPRQTIVVFKDET